MSKNEIIQFVDDNHILDVTVGPNKELDENFYAYFVRK